MSMTDYDPNLAVHQQNASAAQLAAEAALFESELPILQRKVRNCVFNRSDQDDIVQETALIALQKLRRHEIDHPNRLRAFLAGVARNVLRERLREKSRIDQLQDYHVPTVDSAIPEDGFQVLLEKIATLTQKRDRDVLTACLIQGTPYRFLAQHHGVSPDHVYRIVCRAKRRLLDACE